MVFSASTVLDSKKRKASTLVEQVEYDFDKNIFDEAVDFLNKENVEFSTLFEGIYSDFKGAIKEIDFGTILSKIFDVFVSAIGNLLNSFGAFMLNFVNKDAQLAAFKGKLANYRGNIRYTKPYYTYTNIAPNSNTSIEYKRQIEKVKNDFVSTLEGLSKVSAADLVAAFGDTDPINIDEIRGQLVGQKSVSIDAYHDELFKYFRNGEMNRTEDRVRMFEKNIDGNRIAVAYKDYYNSKKEIATINREGMKYRAEALAAKVSIRTYNPIKSIQLAPNVIVEYNKFVSKNCGYIRDICNTYILFFAAKIEAIKEYNKTNKEILLLVCKQMTRESGNND